MIDSASEVRRIAEQYVDAGPVTGMDLDLAELGMDSLRMVAFMVELEARFAVSFPAELVDSETFRTPGNALAALRATRSDV